MNPAPGQNCWCSLLERLTGRAYLPRTFNVGFWPCLVLKWWHSLSTFVRGRGAVVITKRKTNYRCLACNFNTFYICEFEAGDSFSVPNNFDEYCSYFWVIYLLSYTKFRGVNVGEVIKTSNLHQEKGRFLALREFHYPYLKITQCVRWFTCAGVISQVSRLPLVSMFRDPKCDQLPGVLFLNSGKPSGTKKYSVLVGFLTRLGKALLVN